MSGDVIVIVALLVCVTLTGLAAMWRDVVVRQLADRAAERETRKGGDTEKRVAMLEDEIAAVRKTAEQAATAVAALGHRRIRN